MKKLFYFMMMAMAAVSCVYPFQAEVEGESHDLVVEGDIVPGDVTRIYLRYSVPVNAASGMTGGVNAAVSVEDEKGKVYKARKVGSELYEMDTEYASPDLKYRLKIQADGMYYETDFMAVTAAPKLGEVTYQLSEENAEIVLSLQGKDDNRHYKVSYLETWEYHADYRAKVTYDPISETFQKVPDTDVFEFYYCWRTARPSESVLMNSSDNVTNSVKRHVIKRASRRDKRFSIVYRMDIEVSAISDGAYDYLKNLQQSSNGSGDLFTPTPSRMESNVRCVTDPSRLVVGYVDAVRKSEIRYQLDCRSRNIYRVPILNDEQNLFIPDTEELTLNDYYTMGFRPVDDRDVEGGPYYWANAICTDCRKEGGNKNKPEDWPTFDE